MNLVCESFVVVFQRERLVKLWSLADYCQNLKNSQHFWLKLSFACNGTLSNAYYIILNGRWQLYLLKVVGASHCLKFWFFFYIQTCKFQSTLWIDKAVNYDLNHLHALATCKHWPRSLYLQQLVQHMMHPKCHMSKKNNIQGWFHISFQIIVCKGTEIVKWHIHELKVESIGDLISNWWRHQ